MSCPSKIWENIIHDVLVFTTQVNSAFHVRWSASSEMNSNVQFSSEQNHASRVKFLIIFRYIGRIQSLFGICVVYTETIIHLNVGECGVY